jgi:diguanylate cyclase (GGDEF)-like protein
VDQIIRLFPFLLSLLVVFWATPVHAGDTPALTTCIARLEAGQDVRELMGKPGAFDCTSMQHDLGSGDFLVHLRFAPIEAQPHDDLKLSFETYWISDLTIHYRFSDGQEEQLSLTASQLTQYAKIGGGWQFPVPETAVPLTAIFVQIRGAENTRGILTAPKLLSAERIHNENLLLAAFFSGLAGLMISVGVYNAGILFAMRQRVFFEYSMMMASLLALGTVTSGALAMILPGLGSQGLVKIQYAIGACVGNSVLDYFRRFYEGKIEFAWHRRLRQIAGVASLFAATMFVSLAPWQYLLLDHFYMAAMLLVMTALFSYFVTANHMRFANGWLVGVIWSIPIAIGFLAVSGSFGLIANSFWLKHSLLIGMSITSLAGAVIMTKQLTDLRKQRDQAREGEEQAKRDADRDPLTGLYNRRAFSKLITGGDYLCRLMLIDIDNFKQVNDTFGHDVGDKVIAAVAGAISSCQPTKSLSSRFGGEEFVLAMMASEADLCPPQKILDAVRDHPMPYDAKVTVSIGYCDGKVDTPDAMQQLYRMADAALYRAKADGRDRASKAIDFRVVA